jgi:hypothetical protein
MPIKTKARLCIKLSSICKKYNTIEHCRNVHSTKTYYYQRKVGHSAVKTSMHRIANKNKTAHLRRVLYRNVIRTIKC